MNEEIRNIQMSGREIMEKLYQDEEEKAERIMKSVETLFSVLDGEHHYEHADPSMYDAHEELIVLIVGAVKDRVDYLDEIDLKNGEDEISKTFDQLTHPELGGLEGTLSGLIFNRENETVKYTYDAKEETIESYNKAVEHFNGWLSRILGTD